jgi:protein gp37
MAENSKIEWTDTTWNPTTGCTKISPGCAHCYIDRTPPFRMAGRRFEKGHIPLNLHENRLEQPLSWRKPRRVFVNSLSDLFHDDVPDDFLDRVFAVMGVAHWHTFQVLTKRRRTDGRLLRRDVAGAGEGFRRFYGIDIPAPPTVSRIAGIGSMRPATTIPTGAFSAIAAGTAEDSLDRRPAGRGRPTPTSGSACRSRTSSADERIPLLLQVPAAVRFLSCEPLLGGLGALARRAVPRRGCAVLREATRQRADHDRRGMPSPRSSGGWPCRRQWR